ncbi:MAG: PEP-CTERM sorting domain-containing protein [Phycisphaeraceae bacterium]|nr:PEP-CTERM sorting domain-containing protein [Phycisphaeraceae bacterium]
MIRSLMPAVAVAAMTSLASATTITQWDFNGGTADPSTGSGTIGTVGSATHTGFFSGGGSSDPTQPGLAYQTAAYPAQGSGSGTAGIVIEVDTTGYENIVVSWDLRASNTGSGWGEMLYTTDGSTWVSAGAFQLAGGNLFTNGITFDLSSVPAAGNNADFAFRVVSIFEPGGSGYVAAAAGSNYSTSGTWRFDMITVSGTQVPAPATLLVLAGGLLAGGRRRRAA